MSPADIRLAIEKARKGIAQYVHLMQAFPKYDVSTDADFQRKYNAFYRVQRRKDTWYKSYYALMQHSKKSGAEFDITLDAIFRETGRYEPSFASKLVATLDPSKPVWDVHVLANTNHRPPSYSHAAKLSMAKVAYDSIVRWYAEFLKSDDGKLCINEFDRLVPEHNGITDLKKVDFILWQTRSARPTRTKPKPKNAA